MFNHDAMLQATLTAITAFLAEHRDETFYGFSIDACRLCLNSEERFRQTLAWYQQRFPERYTSEQDIEDLRSNTGDWAYQGFFELEAEQGFDHDLYQVHYDEPHASTDYATAMSRLVEALRESTVFDNTRTAPTFYINWVEHDY